MSEIPAPVETVVRAKRIHLTCYQETDAPSLWELIARNHDRLIESFPILLSTVNDEASAGEFIRGLMSDFAERKRYAFSIRKGDDNTIIGHCIIREIDWSVPKGELAYWIDDGHEGKGYAREAMEALLNIAFQTLEMKKLFLRALPQNRRSLDLAVKCGFSREGYLRDDFKTGTGVVSDIVYCGLTRKDFLARSRLGGAA
jgi:RimJ/RimL family protein N-acetyltransferase